MRIAELELKRYRERSEELKQRGIKTFLLFSFFTDIQKSNPIFSSVALFACLFVHLH